MSEVQETRKPNRFRITSIVIACLMLTGAFGVFIGPFTINISAAPDTHTWDGGGGDAFAGTSANWVTDIHPEAGDSVIFNAGALPCTWNLSITLNAFSMNAGYSGTITPVTSFGTTGDLTIGAGVLTGDAAYFITVAGSITQTAGTGSRINAIMTGISKTISITTVGAFNSINIALGATISTTTAITIGSLASSGLFVYGSLTVTASQVKAQTTLFIASTGTVSISDGAKLTIESAIPGPSVTNLGSISGAGSFYVQVRDYDIIGNIGSVFCSMRVTSPSYASESFKLILNATATVASTLLVDSGHASYTVSLDLSSSNYALSATSVSIGTRGIINGRGSLLNCSGNWDSSAGSFTQGTSTVLMSGVAKTIKTATSEQFYRLTIRTGASYTLQNNIVTYYYDLIGTLNLNGHNITELSETFVDAYYPAIFGATGGSEPTVLSSATQMDIWAGGYYRNTTDGITYSTTIPFVTAPGMNRPYVLEVGGTYYMYVSNISVGGAGRFYLFTSTDKIHFTAQGLVLDLGTGTDWDSTALGNMCVWVEGPIWYMLYEAHGTTWRIGLATSSDGITWIKYAGNPVLNEDPLQGGCGRPIIARVNSTVLQYGGEYYLYYHQQSAAPDYGLGVCRAHSTDLKNWSKEGQVKNIIPAGPPFINNGDQSLAEFQGKTYLYYSPTDQVSQARCDVIVDNRTFSEILAIPPGDPLPFVNIWNQTTSNLASDPANWLNGAVPLDNQGVLFDWHSTANCTWDLTGSYGAFEVDSEYGSGAITLTSSFNVTSYYQVSGIVIGNATKILTASEGFICAGGTITPQSINLVMTGNSTINTVIKILESLTIDNANTVVVIGETAVNGNLTIGVGSNLFINPGMLFNWRLYGGGTFANYGNISGTGTVYINTYGGSPTGYMHTGNITANLALRYIAGTPGNVTVTADGDWTVGSFYTINPGPTYTITLDLSSFNYTLSATDITIGSKAILNGRSSAILCSGDWNSSEAISILGTPIIFMNGTQPTISLKSSQQIQFRYQNVSILPIVSVGILTLNMIDNNAILSWDANCSDPMATALFTLSGLESGRMYKVYIDGIQSRLLTASGSGVISFTYSGPWSEHEFEIIGTSITGSISPLVNLIFIMFGIGIVVGVVAEGTNSLRKQKMPTTEQMMKTLLNMVIYIIIGLASLGIMYSVVV